MKTIPSALPSICNRVYLQKQYAVTMYMLKHFTQFYKQDLKQLNVDAYIFLYGQDHSLPSHSCPSCTSLGSLSPHASYERGAIVYNKGIVARRIVVTRLICVCGCTHAVLPELIVPYGRYSILFMLMALKSYYLRSISGETVVGVAMRYEIAVSTLYRWKVLFEEHKRLWLGVLASVSEDVGRFIEKFISERSESSGLLCGFTLRFGFSFMQGGTYASRYSMGRAGP